MKLLAQEPFVMMFQEVTEEMYWVMKEMLSTWSIYRKSKHMFSYFNATAVKTPEEGRCDKTTCTDLPCSESGRQVPDTGRHVLTVRRGGYTFSNIQAESGSQYGHAKARRDQFSIIAKTAFRECEEEISIFGGDFNMRRGEDVDILSAGWREASPGEHTITWRHKTRADICARFDRFYTMAARGTAIEILAVKILPDIMGKLSDHAPLSLSIKDRNAIMEL